MKKRICSFILAFVMVVLSFATMPLCVSADSGATPAEHYVPNGFLTDAEFFLTACYYDAVNERNIQFYIDNNFDIHFIEDSQYLNFESGEVLMPANIAKYTAELAGRFTFYKNGGYTETAAYKIKSSDGKYLSVSYEEETSTGKLQLTSNDEGALWYYYNYGICQIVGSNFFEATNSYDFVCNYSVYLDRSGSSPKLAVDVLEGFTWSYENFEHQAISPMYRSCDHKNMEKHDAVSVTCLSDGSAEYYFCKDCENYFFDSEGRDRFWEKKEVKIYASGHRDDNADLVCDNCEQRIAPSKFELVTGMQSINAADEYILVDENGYALVQRPSSEKGGEKGGYDYNVTPAVRLNTENDGSIDYYKAKKNGAYIFKFIHPTEFEGYDTYGFYSYGTMMECMEKCILFENDEMVKYGQIVSFGNDGEVLVYPMYCENWETNGDYLKTAKQGEYGEVLFCNSNLEENEKAQQYEYCKVYLYRAVADTVHTHRFGKWTKNDENTHIHSCDCGESETENHNWLFVSENSENILYECEDCGATKTEVHVHDFIDWIKKDDEKHIRSCTCGATEEAAHSWDDGIITTDQTHLVDGIKTHTCRDCGAQYEENLGKKEGHTFGNWIPSNDGVHHERSCECGASETAEHNYDFGVVLEQPTHSTKGSKVYTCADCGNRKTEEIPVLTEHSYGEWIPMEDEIHHIRYCVCQAFETAEHVWDDGEVTKTATHNEEGEMMYICLDCGATKTETIPILTEHVYGEWIPMEDETHHIRYCVCQAFETAEHVWDDGEVETPASHLKPGRMKYTCTVCGGTKYEDIPCATAHEWSVWRRIDDDNLHKRICDCGASETAPHNFDDGRITVPATHTEKGEKTFTCVDCGFTKTEEIPMLPEDDPGTTEEITVSVEDGLPLPEGTVIVASQPDDNEVKEIDEQIKEQVKVILQTSEEETPVVLAVYDISLDCDGVAVQPDGTVAVTLPAPELTSRDAKLQVIYISSTGEIEMMETTVNPDGSITFKTTHFSRYAIVEIVNENASSPEGGLSVAVIVLIIVFSVAVVSVVTLICMKKVKKREE